MKVSGEKSFEAPRSVVWEVLNDPARMAKLMPGIESFDIENERNWSARVKVPLGLGALPLSFAFEKTEERPPEYARLAAKGKGVGAIVSMDTQFHLSEAAREPRCSGKRTSRLQARSGRWVNVCCSRSSTSRSETS